MQAKAIAVESAEAYTPITPTKARLTTMLITAAAKELLATSFVFFLAMYIAE